MILKILRRFGKTYIFILKSMMYISLYLTFHFLYVPFIDETFSKELLRFSRVTAIVASTFAILIICLIRIYGGYSIGKKKSKTIIYGVFLATLLTDLITYLQLSVMIKNVANLIVLATIVIIQFFIIVIFTRFGNFMFFSINPPQNCLIIYDNIDEVNQLISKINRFRKQFKISEVIHFENENIDNSIRANNTIFLSGIPKNTRSNFVEYCYKHNKNIYITPDLADVVVNTANQMLLVDTTLFASTVRGLSFEQLILKRLIDIVVSIISLIVFSPIMLAEAIAIKLHDKGPVLFKQVRITRGGKKFNVLKFRTMIVDADLKEEYRPATDNDTRITSVGRVLRKLRIDEFPQLINILKGEMSIVGPRPERIEHVEKYTEQYPEFRYRLRVKSGLTGLAQIQGKYNTTPKDKLVLDLLYIENYSMWLDLKLMMQTLMVLFKSDSTEGFSDHQVEFIKHERTHDSDEIEEFDFDNNSRDS